jgi:hypothetical protein
MIGGQTIKAQIYAVQSSTQLIPPYSVYLSDYATAGNEKLRVILVQRDLTQPSYQLRLVMTVELNGRVIMRTSRGFNPAPISLSPGIPTVISGAELSPYLDSRNIDFVGYSREQYERTKALPEGSYQITFTAYDYRRQDVQVSNPGSSFYYLAKSEPPLINFPSCGTSVPARMPQQVIFSWLPRNTASPNSASRTLYEFSLYEIRPAGRNPNDIVLSTQPVFRTTTEFSQLVYGPSEPMLIENMVYVWRIRAVDEGGRDAFRNNGYSEVCTFTYGGVPVGFNIGDVKDLKAVGETERRALITWSKGEYDGYKVSYKKTGASHEWFTNEVTEASLAGKSSGELKVFDLEADTEYETRIQAKKSGILGPYSEIIKFRTQPARVAQCGDPNVLPGDPGPPLLAATLGTTVMVDDMEMTLLTVAGAGQDGWYKGHGRISIPYLGGAAFTTKFDRIYINEDRNVVQGRIDFISKGVAAMAEDQLLAQQKRQQERLQQENRDTWAGTQFHDKIFLFDNLDIESIAIDNQSFITITDSENNTIANAEVMQVLVSVPDKAIIIEDKNGDQWVVQKDPATGQTKVTPVEGGGLTPGSNVPVSSDDLNIVRKALRELRREYTDQRIDNASASLSQNKNALDQYLSTRHDAIFAMPSSPATEPMYSEFIEDTETLRAGETEFEEKSKAFKFAEYEYNKTMIVKIFADENRKDDELTTIAQGVIINGKVLPEYLAEEKSKGRKEDDLVTDTKNAILELIDKILNEYVYDIK